MSSLLFLLLLSSLLRKQFPSDWGRLDSQVIHTLPQEVYPARWPLVQQSLSQPNSRVCGSGTERMLGRPHCTKTESVPPSRPDWGLISLSVFCLAPVGLLYLIYLNASEGVLKPSSLGTQSIEKCEEACALSCSQSMGTSQTSQSDILWRLETLLVAVALCQSAAMKEPGSCALEMCCRSVELE